MSRKVKALRAMTEQQVRDYYTMTLAQAEICRLAANSFPSPLFTHVFNFAVAAMQLAEAEAKARGVDISSCEHVVRNAFLEGTTQDFSPEEIPEEEQAEGIET